VFFSILFFSLFVGQITIAQQERRDTGSIQEKKNEFYDQIKKETDKFSEEKEEPKMVFKMDFSGFDLPDTITQFTKFWHNEPISQGRTGTCWCFCTTSFFESEIYRQTKKQVKLSEMYTVYWEYVEKARRFIRERGNSLFAEGSMGNAVVRIWKKYGVVPADAYTGMKDGQKFHDHKEMYSEMNDFLEIMKENHNWNEEMTISTIKSILNHYLGEPPESIEINGKKMTPKEYLSRVLELNLDDYVDFMSLMEKPYYEKVEYEVPDNWWHNENYHNVPLDEFMKIVKQATREGYTICLGGDVSEAGYYAYQDVAMVPTFDIPADFIDEHARQFRFSNESTTDDHGIHLVGFLEKDGKDWYLVKDSGSSSRNGKNRGYYFYHEDYIKLKMMDFMVHKDVVKEVLAKSRQ
jgi:bleomycin hydrolase